MEIGALLEAVLEAMPEAVAITRRGRLVHVNDEFTRLFGYERMECVGQELDDLVMPDGRLHESEMLLYALGSRRRTTMETMRRTATGALVEVSVMVCVVELGEAGDGLFVTYRDIRVQKLDEARLQHRALHDGLTGLANRALFMDRVRLTLARLKRRPDRGFAVVYLDLDGFKKVNDELGHGAGDCLLREVGERLGLCVRPQDTVARLGGDEFALLLDETTSEQEVGRVAERILAELQREVVVDGAGSRVAARVGASLGIAMAVQGGEEAEALLTRADRAMYQAKSAGKGRYVVYEGRG